MNYWDVLNKVVEETLRTGRAGTPVFVRCTAVLAETPETVRGHLAEIAACVSQWFSASPHRVYALTSEDQSHCTVTLTFPAGPTALLTVALGHDRPQMDLFVLGSHGAIYHNEGIQPLRDGSLMMPLSDQGGAMLEAIEASLSAGGPVEVDQEVAG